MVIHATPIAPQRDREAGSDTCFLLCEAPMNLTVVEPAPLPPHPVMEPGRQPERSCTCWKYPTVMQTSRTPPETPK